MPSERDGLPPKRTAISIAFFLFFLLATSSLLRAQQFPRYEVFGGYSFLRHDTPSIGFADYSNLNGWNAEAAVNITYSWSAAIDLSGYYGSKQNAYNFMIGPQYSFRREKSKFFAHLLIGKAQDTVTIKSAVRSGFESVGRAVAAGGGFDWDWSPRITFRVAQADYLNTHVFGNSQNDIRVSTGVILHFGHVGHPPRL